MLCDVNVINEQTVVAVDEARLRQAVEFVLFGEAVSRATIGIAIVDDPTIHAYNRQHLGHDCPTDVLSFPLERDEDSVEGEILVSADTAAATAPRFGWSPADELLLYVIHGLLHLIGYDDLNPTALSEMREREAIYLARFGLRPTYEEADSPNERSTRQGGVRESQGSAGVPP